VFDHKSTLVSTRNRLRRKQRSKSRKLGLPDCSQLSHGALRSASPLTCQRDFNDVTNCHQPRAKCQKIVVFDALNSDARQMFFLVKHFRSSILGAAFALRLASATDFLGDLQ
jgi:hypothetical protein